MLPEKTVILELFVKSILSRMPLKCPTNDFQSFVVDYTFLQFTLEIDFGLYDKKNLRFFCSKKESTEFLLDRLECSQKIFRLYPQKYFD